MCGRVLALATLLTSAVAQFNWTDLASAPAPSTTWVTAAADEYPCRWVASSGDAIAGRRNGQGSSCSVPVNATEYVGTAGAPPQRAEVLTLAPGGSLAWSATILTGTSAVRAGTWRGRPSLVCRARHPTTQAGPFSGHTTGVPSSVLGVACLIPVGQSLAALEGGFEYLLALPAGFSSWGAPGLAFVSASPSPSPSLSATPSTTPSTTPSPTPSVSALPAGQPLWLPAPPRGAFPSRPALLAGREGVGGASGASIYVCLGALPNATVAIPGKWEAGWTFCDIAVTRGAVEVEENDATFSLLADSPWMVWGKAAPLPVPSGAPNSTFLGFHAPLPGAALVTAGFLPPALGGATGTGSNLTVCRAYHPTVRTGPHAGWVAAAPSGTSGTLPACVFSYGGGAVRVTAASGGYDVLWAAPASLQPGAINALRLNISVAAPPPLPSATPSRSPSRTPSPSRSPAAGPAAVWAEGLDPTTGLPVATAGSPSSWVRTRWDAVSSTHLCAAVFPDGSAVPGRWTLYGGCTIPPNVTANATAGAPSKPRLLLSNPWLVWSRPESLPAGSAPVSTPAEAEPSGRRLTVCRAWYAPTRGGPFPGFVARVDREGKLCGGSGSGGSGGDCNDACLMVQSGLTHAAPAPFDVLALLPGNLTAAQAAAWNGSVPLPAPSASPTPSLSPSPSPSMAPPVYGEDQWLGPLPDGRWTESVEAGSETPGGPVPAPLADRIYVCRGWLPGGEVLPGKLHWDWSFCDVAVKGVELVDTAYETLRLNPAYSWWPANASLPTGARVVEAGTYQGLPAVVCRGFHPTTRSGPHAGFTDLEPVWLSGAQLGVCTFSYGGHIVRVAAFDLLVALSAPSVTPSPTSTPLPSLGPSNSSSSTPTPSPSGTPTPSPSASASSSPAPPSATGSSTPSASPSPTPSGTPSLSLSGTASTTLSPSSTPTPSGTPSTTASLPATPSPSPSPPATRSLRPAQPPPSAGSTTGSSTTSAPAAPSTTTTSVVVAAAVVLMVGGGYWAVRRGQPSAVQLSDDEEAPARAPTAPAAAAVAGTGAADGDVEAGRPGGGPPGGAPQ